MIGLGKVVLPLLAPYALASAGIARARWDAYRAARLGVTPSQLNAYSGRGGALHARIDQLAAALDDLDDGAEAHATTAARRFARESRPRLEDLALAVRAAEQMPGRRPNGLTPRPPHTTEAARAAARRAAPFGGRHAIYRPPLEGRHPPRFGGRGRCDLSVGAASL